MQEENEIPNKNKSGLDKKMTKKETREFLMDSMGLEKDEAVYWTEGRFDETK